MRLKIRTRLPLLLILLLSFSPLVAQEPASTLESLYLAFWPDYDDPSVLVLMTGTLSADTVLPAEVTIPIPPQAEVNAVARIGVDGSMADTEFAVDGDRLTLVTPDPRFRVEYYVPYAEEGDQRNFDFVWNADLDVQELVAEIQQPLNAAELTTEPAALTVGTSPNDGLTYHALPAQTLSAGTPFSLSFSYVMTDPGLTASAAAPPPAPAAPAEDGGGTALANVNWLLLGAGLVILVLAVVVTWLLANRSGNNRRSGKSRRPRKPAPKERVVNQARFCHNCGAGAATGDQFCRSCGTKLK
jgi:hypothetical protein